MTASSVIVNILPAGIEFNATNEQTVLEAALSQGFFLGHSCKKGTCGTCKAEIVSGQLINDAGQMMTHGDIFTCAARALSDVVLKAKYFPELAHIECKILPCKVASCIMVAEDILWLTLRLPPQTEFTYLPGQYIDLLHNGLQRSYSIANFANRADGLELHIRLLPEGQLSRQLQLVNNNQLLRMEGPKGTFFVKKANNPLLFIAGGTGFAPIKAMIEQLIAAEDQRDIHLYWGMTHSSRFYCHSAMQWARQYKHIRYVPVVSGTDDAWQGVRGWVHEAVLADFTDLTDYHVYACGAAVMLEAVEDSLVNIGLHRDNFFKDTFVPSNELG